MSKPPLLVSFSSLMLLPGKKPNAQPTFEREDAMNPSDKFVTASAKKWDS